MTLSYVNSVTDIVMKLIRDMEIHVYCITFFDCWHINFDTITLIHFPHYQCDSNLIVT